MSLPQLYTANESGNCYKVRLLAAFLDIDLEYIELDFMNGEHRLPKYLAINPRATMPALIDGHRIFNDSAAILIHLAGTYPDPGSSEVPSSFWSSNASEQGEITDWLAFSADWIQHLSIARAVLNFKLPLHDRDLAEAQKKGARALSILEKKFEKEDWLVLGRPTIADIAAFPYVALAPMGDVSLDPYPAVRSWIARVRKLPQFIPIKGLDDPMYRRRGNNL